MTGPSIDPATFSAKIDRILALLDIINGNTSAARPSSTMDFVVEDPVLQQGAVAVDGTDQHDLVDPTAADETLGHALHMEELIQIADCNQLRSFDEAPAAVHIAESDRIDSVVVAAPPSSTTSPAGADFAGVQPEDVAAPTIQIGVPSGPAQSRRRLGHGSFWGCRAHPSVAGGCSAVRQHLVSVRRRRAHLQSAVVRRAAPGRHRWRCCTTSPAVESAPPLGAKARGFHGLLHLLSGRRHLQQTVQRGPMWKTGLLGWWPASYRKRQPIKSQRLGSFAVLCVRCCCFSGASGLVHTNILMFPWDPGKPLDCCSSHGEGKDAMIKSSFPLQLEGELLKNGGSNVMAVGWGLYGLSRAVGWACTG
jgi:hypothetical protein